MTDLRSGEQGEPQARAPVLGVMWLAAGLLGALFLLHGARSASQPSDGFAAYYTSARLVRQGEQAVRFYDQAWFRAQTERLAPGASDIFNVNPPTAALLLLPLAGLDHIPARFLWTGVNLLLAAACVAVLWRELRLKAIYPPVLLCFVFAFQPLHANFRHGQAYLALLALLLLAWYGYRHRRPALLGVGLGLLLILKTAALPLWVLVLAQRRWRALLWGGLTILGTGLVSLPLLGLDAWATYVRLLPQLATEPWLAVTAYQSQYGFFRHLLIFDPQWNPEPLLNAPWLGTWLPALATLAVVAASARASWRAEASDPAFALFALASIVLSPVSVDYHYTLGLLPVAVLLARVPFWRSWPASLGLIMAVLLIGADLPYQSPQLQVGAWAFLAYPKLYGGLLLWALALAAARKDRLEGMDDAERHHARTKSVA